MNTSSLPTKTIYPVGAGFQQVSSTTASLMQKIKHMLNWKVIMVVIFCVLLVIVSYYLYKQYTTNKTSFSSNREHSQDDVNKTAQLMMFYVDWCPHCKTAKPEWEALKDEYNDKVINGYNVSFMEYNCTNETNEITELMDRFNIEGYPTIKLIKDNQVIEYDAKPTKSTMLQFLNTVL